MKAIERANRAISCALLVGAVTFFPLPSAHAENSIVVDVTSGRVLWEKNAVQRWYPASTTKLMTAYVVLKALQTGKASLDTPVVMTRYAAGQAPSKMGFPAGSVMRLDTALRMMLVKSANDVAVAIGQTIGGGSLEAFVGMMNVEAAELGMHDSVFVNPNGLPGPGQYSSAKDLAILAMRLRRDFPAFSEIFGTEAISAGSVTIRNTNSLLGRYDGADGMKTGYICASGFNLVASATRDKRTLVAVVLGADGPIVRDRITAEILENGFKADAAKAPTTILDMPASSGGPGDISATVCSPAGAKARAEERVAEQKRDHNSGSPYLHAMDRPPVVVPLALGGAAGSDTIEPGVSLIAAYGIPIPTPRPDSAVEAAPPVGETGPAGETETGGEAQEPGSQKSSSLPAG